MWLIDRDKSNDITLIKDDIRDRITAEINFDDGGPKHLWIKVTVARINHGFSRGGHEFERFSTILDPDSAALFGQRLMEMAIRAKNTLANR